MTYPAVYGPVYTGAVVIQPGYLVVPPGVTWLAANGASVSTLAPFAPDPFGPPDISPWYVPYSGFIERLPQQWDDLLRGYTEAAITDAWFGANFNPQPILVTEILNDMPSDGTGFYWPCTDQPGSALASNLAPGNTAPLYVTQTKYGSGGATQAFGQNSSGLLGAQQTLVVSPSFRLSNQGGMWGLTLSSASPAPQTGFSLECTSGNFPVPSAGVTAEFWFQSVAPYPAGLDARVIRLDNSRSTIGTSLWSIFIDEATGELFLIWDGAGGGQAAIGASGVDYRTGPLSLVSVTFTNKAWTAYINGTETASGNFSPHLGAFGYLSLNGASTPVAVDQCFSGFIGHVALFPFILPANRINTHYQAGITGMAGEYSQNRIERLLQAGGVTGRRVIIQQTDPFSTHVVSCQDIPGQPISSSVDNIAQDLLPGMFFIAPTGDIYSLPRQRAFGQEVQWTLGEQKYAGEYQYGGEIAFDFDPTRVQDQIQLTQLDNQDIIVPSVTAIEAAAQKQVGTISNLSTGYLQGDATEPLNFGPGLYDLANWLATTYQAPQLRLTQVTVDASKDPSRWPFVLGVSNGDVTQVNRRPPGSGNTLIAVTGRITQTQRRLQFSLTSVAASVTCIVDPAPEVEALTLDSVTDGVLTGGPILAW